MQDTTIEIIVAKSIEIGVHNTLGKLGLLNDQISESQAKKMYGKRLINEWRRKRWIVGYPTGNKERRKVYYKRTELETASRMLDIQNIVHQNKIIK